MNTDRPMNIELRKTIEHPDDPLFDDLIAKLSAISMDSGLAESWPEKQLTVCDQFGVFRWFIPRKWNGSQWSMADIAKGYIKLASACLTTTFVITQRAAACRRIASTVNEKLQSKLLPDLCTNRKFATVGISHLSTSRRHLKKPVLQATKTSTGYVLDGFSPWVTGGVAADHIVIGATTENGDEVVFALPSTLEGVTIEPGHRLIALTGSMTGAIRCANVEVSSDWLLDGPRPEIMNSASKSGGTGGLQTSTLACGLANAAIRFIGSESEKRPELKEHFEKLDFQSTALQQAIVEFANDDSRHSKEELREKANSLVLRATQSALVAAKGAGFVRGHNVGRWCQEALFFLVWSCPQSVLDANLCELAGVE